MEQVPVSTVQTHLDFMDPASEDQVATSSVDSQRPPAGSSSLPVNETDEWFHDNFERLYDQVVNFVDYFFCQVEDLLPKSTSTPWINMSSEFVRYSTMVAGPGGSLGDWNRILFRRSERWYLLVGILARIIEAKIFGELLFGGNEIQKKQLEDLERSSAGVEGFSRTEERAHNVKATKGDCLTPEFDSDVARLSRQIVMLLKPLSKFLDLISEHGGVPAEFDENQFRSIHDIVTMAAHLSIRVRQSPTIFYFHSERPGNSYDPTDQTDMDYPAYVASKSKVTEGPDTRNSESKQYRALVRFAVWPSIKRYSAGIGSRGHEISGFRVYNISKSRVVYCWGIDNYGHRASMGLPTFLEQQRRSAEAQS